MRQGCHTVTLPTLYYFKMILRLQRKISTLIFSALWLGPRYTSLALLHLLKNFLTLFPQTFFSRNASPRQNLLGFVPKQFQLCIKKLKINCGTCWQGSAEAGLETKGSEEMELQAAAQPCVLVSCKSVPSTTWAFCAVSKEDTPREQFKVYISLMGSYKWNLNQVCQCAGMPCTSV